MSQIRVVRVATASHLPPHTSTIGVLTATAKGAFPPQDGITLALNDSILAKDEVAAQQNGVYVLTQVGDASSPWILTRRGDFNEAGVLLHGVVVAVLEGVFHGNTQWFLKPQGKVEFGTTPIMFSEVDLTRINVREYGAIGNGSHDDVEAFDAALTEVYRRRGGEVFVPNGIYKLSRGIRGPADFMQVRRNPPGAPKITVSGPDHNHDKFRLKIEVGGPRGKAKFKWSKNWAKTWEEKGVTIPDSVTGSYTLPGTDGITVNFSDGNYAQDTEYFWPGNGAYPVPPNCRIVGENQSATILSFTFEKSGDQGDGIRLLWNPVAQAGRLVSISDLTIENISKTNRLENTAEVHSSGASPPRIVPSGHPYRDNFDFRLEITAFEKGNKTGSFRYSTGQKSGGDFDWLQTNVPFKPGQTVDLLGTGVTVEFSVGVYTAGNTYTWGVSGYAGAGILCTGDGEATIERVSVLGFARSIILDGTNNATVSHCLLFETERHGSHVVGLDASMAVWITGAGAYYQAVAGAGQSNIHRIENCGLGGHAVSIWHEDGELHTVRQCNFGDTKVCALFGATNCVRYENCYTENVGANGGAFFEMSRGGIASQIAIENCWLANRAQAPLLRLTKGTLSTLIFSGNHLGAGAKEGPLLQIQGLGGIQSLFWNSSAYLGPSDNTSHFIAADIPNVPALVAKLQNDPDPATKPVSDFVWGKFSQVAKQVLTDPGTLLKDRLAALLGELNKILEGDSIYEPARFDGVIKARHMRPLTLAVLAQSLPGQPMIHLNRLLLEDTYPNELTKPPVLFEKDPITSNVFLPGKHTFGGIGLGTLAPRANLHLRQFWTQAPLFLFEREVSGHLKSYQLSSDASTLSHVVGSGDKKIPHGIFQVVKTAVTFHGSSKLDQTDPTVVSWTMVNEQYVHAEATFLVTDISGVVCSFWKLRALVRKIRDKISVVGGVSILDANTSENPGFSVPTIEVAADNGALLFKVHQGTSPRHGHWTIKVDITQRARGGLD